MEDGRAIEVTVKMKGGMGKKRGKKNGTRIVRKRTWENTIRKQFGG